MSDGQVTEATTAGLFPLRGLGERAGQRGRERTYLGQAMPELQGDRKSMTTLYSADQIRGYAAGAGFTNDALSLDLNIAVAVALAESRGNAEAEHHDSDGSTDYGLWQINTVHSDLLSRYKWWLPIDNARMAFEVFVEAGYRWTPWSTYTSGEYRKYLGGEQVITVARGDTIISLARNYLGDAAKWRLIWSDPHNAGLTVLRGSPSLIRPGDRIFIPAVKP
jgi:hypothetical protein